MSDLIQTIYSSVATRQFRPASLPFLVKSARAANARRGVTGMLLYVNGNFLQALEGPARSIDSLLTGIKDDSRHYRVATLLRETIAARSFAKWSMGFATLGSSDVNTLAGDNDFFESGTSVSSLSPAVVQTLLLSFCTAKIHHRHN